MPDVVLDSSFNWSPVRTGMEEMRAFANQSTRAIGRDVSGMFAGATIATAALATISAGIGAILRDASELNKLSQRFRIDPEALQVIGNAAQEADIELAKVANSLNKLELSAYKAAQGSKAEADALAALNLNAEEFNKLPVDEKFLALADAYVAATDKAAAYAAVAALIGTRNTEMIALMNQGSAAIRAQGDAFRYTAEQVKLLDEAGDTLKRFGRELKVIGATVITDVLGPILKGMDGINQAIADVLGGLKEIAAGNFLAGLQQFLTGTKPIAPQTIQPVPLPPGATPPPGAAEEAGGPGAAATSAATKAQEEQITLAGKLAKIQRDAGFARLSDEGKLGVLQRELNALKAQEVAQDAGTVEQAKTLIAIAEKEGEIEKLSGTMANEKAAAEEKTAALREQMAAAADKELRASKEATLEAQLQLAGRKDLADRAKIEFEFNEKILDVQKEIEKAQNEGLDDVAETNRALVDQLESEKQIALAVHDKATAEEAAAAAAKDAAKAAAEYAAQMAALRDAQNDTIRAGIELDMERGRISSETAGFERRSVDLQIRMNELSMRINDARASGNELLAQQLEIEQGITAEQNRRARDAAFAEQLRTKGTTIGQPGTDALGRMAAMGIHMGGLADAAYYTALMQGASPAEAAAAQMKMAARMQVDQLTGRDSVGFAERAQLMANMQTYLKQQQFQAQQQSDQSLRQQIAYWGAIAAGRQPAGNNPYLGMYGVPNFGTGQFSPLGAGGQADLLASLLQQLQGQGITQTQLLQAIASNTSVVTI